MAMFAVISTLRRLLQQLLLLLILLLILIMFNFDVECVKLELPA